MLRCVGYVVAIALLVAAVAINKNLPTDRTTQAAFTVSGSKAEWLVGRDIAAKVNGIAVVDQLLVDEYGRAPERTTAGRWFVVDATVDVVLTPGSAPKGIFLVIGDDRYSATNRITAGLNSAQFAPGLPRRGLLAFEVPVTATTAKVATLTMSRALDDRLDSELEFELSPADAPRLSQVQVGDATRET